MSSSWQHFSVQEFCNLSNWSGKALVGTVDTNDIFQEVPWLCQKIEDFFNHSNWKGELMSEISRPVFSLTLTVASFFQLFPWEANSEIAPLPKLKLEPIPESDSPPSDELRLDNFTNLF